jgi:hypothetical protein
LKVLCPSEEVAIATWKEWSQGVVKTFESWIRLHQRLQESTPVRTYADDSAESVNNLVIGDKIDLSWRIEGQEIPIWRAGVIVGFNPLGFIATPFEFLERIEVDREWSQEGTTWRRVQKG